MVVEEDVVVDEVVEDVVDDVDVDDDVVDDDAVVLDDEVGAVVVAPPDVAHCTEPCPNFRPKWFRPLVRVVVVVVAESSTGPVPPEPPTAPVPPRSPDPLETTTHVWWFRCVIAAWIVGGTRTVAINVSAKTTRR